MSKSNDMKMAVETIKPRKRRHFRRGGRAEARYAPAKQNMIVDEEPFKTVRVRKGHVVLIVFLFMK